ncbi:putative serine/threonine-specific protein kinase pkpA Phycomyces blakesleeanus [Phycomyces blakesleeanus]|uniref:Serine/threonine-specific protein kinase pkpA Phycomyces blakesleeanus n=1 Tax=Phycomyces blakesleeanus TaxID=4837 RepID=A0ABR3BI14_PHYBL
MSHSNEIIDQSSSHDTEKVIEDSPDERYARLNTLLGKGAYKIVYKAIDRVEGYEVAWNTMTSSHSPDSKEMQQEISILKSVRHPNIIAFHDAWHMKNEFVFVTELMTSGTLREYIRKLSLPNIKIVKRWSRQILKGLAYLHDYSPSIIHRDIKCDNIFINGAHGEVKIGDMGTAEMKMGKKYTIIGTPEFMAPEMYEEEGYSEKVDIYAFGMCLLEMATGEYPYGECKNAAQIYKKVSSGVKPVCLQKVQNNEVLALIANCLGPEEDRMTAQEILEHSFLAVEPDVVLLAADPTNVHLTLQVVFKGMDKLSVKFDFNVETDTAEQVVKEMIEEQVLPDRYQHHITKEINRILRDIEKPSESEQAEQVRQSVWRRESDIRSELDKIRLELEATTKHARELETKCEMYENRARSVEVQYREALKQLREVQEQHTNTTTRSRESSLSTPAPSRSSSVSSRIGSDLKVDVFPESDKEEKLKDDKTNDKKDEDPVKDDEKTTNGKNPPTYLSEKELAIRLDREHPEAAMSSISPTARDALMSRILEEYSDDTDISDFVQDCATAAHRSAEKAKEWADKLKDQDIMTVGDLRDLHDEDWTGIGLTVFAFRALKNMLKGKRLAGQALVTTTSTNDNTPSSSAPNSARLSPTT